MLGAGAAALAVLAVLVALLLPFLLDRDNDSGQPAPQAQPTATASTPQPTETTPSPDAAAPPPAGYRLYKDAAGWSVAVPTGWTATRKGAAVSFTSGDRILRVTVGGNPPRDPYDAALELEPAVKAATPGYDFMRIARVTYRGWPTADWEYRAGTSTRTHSLIRSIVPNPQRVYDILCTTEDRRWAADRTFFDIAARTFDPGS
jgi:eukaryotic-like serine/threonine-protein kinase